MKVNKFSLQYQIKRFNLSEEEAKNKIKKIREGCKSGNIYSIEWQIKRYNLSKKEAKYKIEEIKEKARKTQRNMSEFDFKAMSSSNFEHWIKKGYSKEESIKKSKEHIKHMQAAYQKKKKENPEQYKSSFNTIIEYWIKKGYSKKEAKEKLKTRQNTNNLKTYIKKYGDSGYDKWKARNKKWSIEMEKKYLNNEYSKSPKESFSIFSKIELEFVALITEHINNIETQFKIYKKKVDVIFMI